MISDYPKGTLNPSLAMIYDKSGEQIFRKSIDIWRCIDCGHEWEASEVEK
jgi:rubrerythrin